MDGEKGKDNFGAEFEEKGLNNNSEFSLPAAETGEPPKIQKYELAESRRMFRNIIVISLAFTLLFTAYTSMANLQSSINQKDGLGNWSSSVVYASMVVSALFVPTAFIRKTTVKWAMFFSMFGYTTFIAAQFYPEFYTLLPAAAVVGISAAPLWAAKCTYLTHVGNEYAELRSDIAEVVIVRFFGIFFMAFQTNAVFGNVISSTILSSSLGSSAKNVSSDDQLILADYSRCGAEFCPDTKLSSSEEEDNDTKIYILSSVYLVIALMAAAVIGLFVDSLKRYGETKREGSTMKLLIATFQQMANPYQILIIPLTIWSGLEQGFLSADYTAAYITCGWGLENVGYVLICYGLADSISCIVYSPLVRYVGRVIVFYGGAVLNIGLIIGLLLWRPSPDSKVVFFVMAALWGVADSCWQCGINAYYGVIFPTNVEASFSNYRLWESIGFVIAFAIANVVCVDVKLYILLGTLVVGMIGFSIIEFFEWKRLKKEKSEKNRKE